MSPTAATATKPQVIKSLVWLEKPDTGEDMNCKTAESLFCTDIAIIAMYRIPLTKYGCT